MRFDDGFRGGIAMLVSLIALLAGFGWLWWQPGALDHIDWSFAVFVAACVALSIFSLIYLVWTHLLFTRAEPAAAAQIAAAQHQRGPGRLARLLGFGATENWALTAAGSALIVAIAASLLSSGRNGLWLPAIVLITAATSWATMTYAFALRYFRRHAAHAYRIEHRAHAHLHLVRLQRARGGNGGVTDERVYRRRVMMPGGGCG